MEKLNNHLENISLEHWNRLFKFIPLIQKQDVFGEWKGGKKDSQGVIEFPYIVSCKVVDDFTNLMYELDLVINFDWGKWTTGREIVRTNDFRNLDNITLIKILTAIIRNDRFNEGVLVGAFEDGTIEKVLIELKINIENTNTNLFTKNKLAMATLKELKEKFHTNYKDSSSFAEKARLLQSIWRTEKGYEFEKYGNFLQEDFAKQTGANFLSKTIFEFVKNEVKTKHEKEKVIQEPRIWNNLLSSQPLAFNMFGELKQNTELATKIFQDLYSERNINNITRIEFEYSPGRRDPKYTGDRSAFDVFIEYENRENKKGFFGIEVKYAETLNDKPSSHKPNYEKISEKSGIFDMSKLDKLKQKPIQQIWRDHLLTLSLFVTNNDYKIGDFVYLYPVDNKNCETAIEKYEQTFDQTKESYFRPLTIEKLTETIKKYCNEDWINEFENRYLNFDKIEKASR